MGLTKTSGYRDGQTLVREMSKALKGTPYKTSRAIPFSFYLYLPDRRKANLGAKALKAAGCEAEVDKSAADDGKWLCLCHATLKVSSPKLVKLGDRLIALAQEHGGQFDGWETNPYKNGGAFLDLLSLLGSSAAQP